MCTHTCQSKMCRPLTHAHSQARTYIYYKQTKKKSCRCWATVFAVQVRLCAQPINGWSVMCLDLLSVFQQLLTYIAVSPHISLGQMAPFTLLPPVPSLKGWGDIFACCTQLTALAASSLSTRGERGGGGKARRGEMLQWIIMFHNMHPSPPFPLLASNNN